MTSFPKQKQPQRVVLAAVAFFIHPSQGSQAQGLDPAVKGVRLQTQTLHGG